MVKYEYINVTPGLFFRSLTVMMGGIMGVGVFGLPYAFTQSGFTVGLLQLLVFHKYPYPMENNLRHILNPDHIQKKDCNYCYCRRRSCLVF